MRHHSFPVWERMATAVREVFWGTVTIAPADRRAPGSMSYFTNGEMRKTEVIGSVRVVYYPMDSDSTLIGMNVSETSKLEIYLQDRKIERMVMSPKSNGVLYPMSQIPAGKDRLENFVWFDYIRPLNKADIFNWREKRVEDQLKKNVRGPVVLPNARLFENKKEE